MGVEIGDVVCHGAVWTSVAVVAMNVGPVRPTAAVIGRALRAAIERLHLLYAPLQTGQSLGALGPADEILPAHPLLTYHCHRVGLDDVCPDELGNLNGFAVAEGVG